MSTEWLTVPIYRQIHGGPWGWVFREVDADCNAFCHGGEHCMTVYTSGEATAEEIKEVFERAWPAPVTRVEPAREAPIPPPGWGFQLARKPEASDPDAVTPWLVFWRGE